ncbi:MAG: hypothetical protein U1G08_07855 [Verrucomicrobiota bacterium]
MFLRSLLLHQSSASIRPCSGGHGCPDLLELESGDFAVIGTDITDHAHKLPTGSGCGAGERIVQIPRSLLVALREALPGTP